MSAIAFNIMILSSLITEIVLLIILIRKYQKANNRPLLYLIIGFVVYVISFIVDTVAYNQYGQELWYLKVSLLPSMMGTVLVISFFIEILIDRPQTKHILLGLNILGTIILVILLYYTNTTSIYQDPVFDFEYRDIAGYYITFMVLYYALVSLFFIIAYFQKIRGLEGIARKKTRFFGLGAFIWLPGYLFFAALECIVLAGVVFIVGHILIAYANLVQE